MHARSDLRKIMSRFVFGADAIVISSSSSSSEDEEGGEAVGAATMAWMHENEPMEGGEFWDDMVRWADQDKDLRHTTSFKLMQKYSDEVAHWKRDKRLDYEWWAKMTNTLFVFNPDARAAYAHVFPEEMRATVNPVAAIKAQAPDLYKAYVDGHDWPEGLREQVNSVRQPPHLSDHSIARLRESVSVRQYFFFNLQSDYDAERGNERTVRNTRALIDAELAKRDVSARNKEKLRSIRDEDLMQHVRDAFFYPETKPENILKRAYKPE